MLASLPPPDSRDEHLLVLGRGLRERGYRFTGVSLSTRERVNRRKDAATAQSLADVFGFGQPFLPALLPEELWQPLQGVDGLEPLGDGRFRSRVRFATAGGGLFLHGGVSTGQVDAVPLGPGEYRYLRALARLPGKFKQVVELRCGAGVGGVFLASRSQALLMADLHPLALRYARVNAALNGARSVKVVESAGLPSGLSGVDLVVVNQGPARSRQGVVATAASVVSDVLAKLEPGAKLLFSGQAPIRKDTDLLLEALAGPLAKAGATFHYEEQDPDVDTELLLTPEYAEVDRLASVVLTATRPKER